jgi:hypothetical protein
MARTKKKSPSPLLGFRHLGSHRYSAVYKSTKPVTRAASKALQAFAEKKRGVLSPARSTDTLSGFCLSPSTESLDVIDDPFEEPLVRLKSHIHNLESAIDSDEAEYGLEQDYEFAGSRNRPLFSSTRGSFDDTVLNILEETIVEDSTTLHSEAFVSADSYSLEYGLTDPDVTVAQEDDLSLHSSLANSVSLPSPTQSISKMSDNPEVQSVMDTLVAADDLWSDDYADCDFTQIPFSAIESLCKEAIRQKSLLAAQYVVVRRIPAADLDESVTPQKVLEMKKLFVAFRDRAWAHMKNVSDPPPPSAPVQVPHTLPPVHMPAADPSRGNQLPPVASGSSVPTAPTAPASNVTDRPTPALRSSSRISNSNMSEVSSSIIADRLDTRKGPLLQLARGLVDRLRDLQDQHPENNQQLMQLEGNLEIVKIEVKEVIDELRTLSAKAVDIGDSEAAKELCEATDDLVGARVAAMTSVAGARQDLGIPIGYDNRNVQLNLKAPVFSGDFKDTLDFYSFEKQLLNYFESGVVHDYARRLIKLKNDCVVGPAKEAIRNTKSFDEAMNVLRSFYAKPQVLLAVKTAEIVNEGKCPDPLIQKRDWFMKISNKFNYIRELASEHELDDFFASTDLGHQILTAMNYHERNEFEKQMIKASRFNPTAPTRRVIAERLACYLNEVVANLGFTLDYRIANGYSCATDMMKSLQLGGKQLPKQNPSQNHRGNYAANTDIEGDPPCADSITSSTLIVAAPGESDGDESGKSTRKDKQNMREQRKSRQAGSHSEMSAAVAVAANAAGFDPTPAVLTNKSKEMKFVHCKLCNQEHESLVYCPKFRSARVNDRFLLCLKTNSCYRCLRSDAGFEIKRKDEWFAEHKPYCSDKFICKHGFCANNNPVQQNHLLVCKFHIMQNKSDHSEFLSSVDQNRLPDAKKFFFTHTQILTAAGTKGEKAVAPIYMLQNIPGKNGQPLLCFYDTGCMEAAINDRAYSLMDTVNVKSGPTLLDVAGGQSIKNPYGYEKFELDTVDGSKVSITGLRMMEITSDLPVWDLMQAWNDVANKYVESGGVKSDLPTCADRIGGGSVDIMIGVEYMNIYPAEVCMLPVGLKLYKTKLLSTDNHLGILGGPHESWARAATAAHNMGPRIFFTAEVRAVASMHINLRTSMMFESPCMPEDVHSRADPLVRQCVECHCWEDVFMDDLECAENLNTASCFQSISADMRGFEAVENIGGVVDYRCTVCRNCTDCKRGEQLEHLSLQEEKEQMLIESCVRLDKEAKTVYSKLPFIKDPDSSLTSNRRVAEKILDTQVRMIDKTSGTREAVQKAHSKLQDKGHVVPLDSLPEEIQQDCLKGGYFIPWRFVWNLGSLSTRLRLVYDASSRTPGGDSLNDILAVGMNKLGKLLHLLVKFRYGAHCFTSDIQMAYNQLKLDPEFYKYQMYLWKENLSPEEKARVMVVITLIYGVRPAGNLTMAGFMELVKYARELGGKYLLGADALEKCSYMDDIFSSYFSCAERDAAAESLREVLGLGQMTVKAVTKSGVAPSDDVSADGESVGVVGYRWYTALDALKLDIKPLTLGKSKRGQPAAPIDGDIADALGKKFTKRVLAGRVASVYDPLGLVTPITSQLKLDMSTVCKMANGWDDKLPVELLPVWTNNLKEISKLAMIEVPRNVGADGEGIHKFVMIVSADASESIAAAAVYSRVELSNGVFDCNLLMAKSKIVNKCSIPRAEMRAATLAAGLAHVVRSNLGQWISKEIFITDSTIVLSWLNQDQRPLQLSVRNSVIQIRRFSHVDDWFHVKSADNPCDIATRPVTVDDIIGESDWFKGRPWMRGEDVYMSLKKIHEIVLSPQEELAVSAEVRLKPVRGLVLTCRESRLSDRYKFSDYLIDPCSRSWPRYQRLVALVIKCVRIWKSKCIRRVPRWKFELPGFQEISEGVVAVHIELDDLEKARRYIFLKTTRELKYFNKAEAYKDIAVYKDEVLVYSGRILDGEEPDSIPGAMIDVGPLTFCNPVLDRYSPVSYSVMLYIHEQANFHGGARSCYRRSREEVYILRGLLLAEEIREACVHCRRYKARLLQAELGKVHPSRFTPAPAFYFVQIDLVGPWKARCDSHPRRADSKVWGVVYKCCTTLCVWVEVCEAYDAASVVDSYIRFSARFGHPGVVYIDPGTNLISACSNMEISYADIAKGINGKGVSIKHEICPAGAHQSQGIVERCIKEVRKIFNAVFKGFGLTYIGYATAFAFISNELNCVPLCLGGKYSNLDHLDLITPARLIMGRNNLRAPVGLVQADVPSAMMKNMEDVSVAWWKVWESEWLVQLVPKPNKWLEGAPDVKVGDVVVFLRDGKESVLGQTPWRTGLIDEVHVSDRDGVCRSLTIKYKNHSESVFRYTKRSTRTVAIIHREGDIDLLGELSNASVSANKHFLLSNRYKNQ